MKPGLYSFFPYSRKVHVEGTSIQELSLLFFGSLGFLVLRYKHVYHCEILSSSVMKNGSSLKRRNIWFCQRDVNKYFSLSLIKIMSEIGGDFWFASRMKWSWIRNHERIVALFFPVIICQKIIGSRLAWALHRPPYCVSHPSLVQPSRSWPTGTQYIRR